MARPCDQVSTEIAADREWMGVPCRPRVVQQHSQSISLLFHLTAEVVATSTVLQVRHHVVAASRAHLVQASGRSLELGLLPAGDDHFGPVLHVALGGHLAEACSTSSDEDDMVLEVEEIRNGEVGRGG